ncbi:MAG: A/G-specific adenine glycosylase [Paludibacteraceae bacterium]|nr:A/G-specific adenine glycosylase [Paludibacteraceae bacterium]
METSARIQKWFAENGRDLPWRHTRDPYRIWVSEIILQQTRIEQGTDYYHRFLQQYPTLSALQQTDETTLLRLWQGLGYYSRALTMLKAARACSGAFPDRYDDLIGLPGIGDYTASAISSFASGECRAAVDGNVQRIIARLYDLEEPVDKPAGAKSIKMLADELLDRRHPGNHNQAMMDFGALQCVPRNPDCHQCPLQAQCLAYARGTVGERPVKLGKTKQRKRCFHYLDLQAGHTRFLRQRPEGDIWTGLYEFFLIESDEPLTSESIRQALGSDRFEIGRQSKTYRHVLSHQQIYADFTVILLPGGEAAPPGMVAIGPEALDSYPLSRLTLRYLQDSLQ